MPTVHVRDIDIYYECRGEGERLLYIGGTGGDLRQQPSVFSGPLARRFETLAYDQRGLGRTSKPDRAYTMADYGEDAAGLMDALGWTRCRVMGVSFGGMVAQELAVRYPGRIEKLVLACTSSGGEGKPSYPLHELASLPEADRIEKTLSVFDTRCDGDWRKKNPDAYEAIRKIMLARATPVDASEETRMGALRQLEARMGHDTWARLPSLTMPVFVCGGRHDGVAPPSNLEATCSRVENVRLQLFEGGHMFLLQDPSAWPAIVEFLFEAH